MRNTPLDTYNFKQANFTQFILILTFLFSSGLTPSFAVSVLWDTDFSLLPVTPGASVNNTTNPWWQSSSPKSRFLIDDNLLVIASQPGHILSNINPILIGGNGDVVLELLIRTDEPSTLSIRANSGIFDSVGGVIRGDTLEVPSIDEPTFSWVTFRWQQQLADSYQDYSIWGEEATATATSSATSTPLTFSLASIDNPFYLAAARLTFTATAAPEPSRGLLIFCGLAFPLLRRKRSAIQMAKKRRIS